MNFSNNLNSLKELRIADFEKKTNLTDYIRGYIPSTNDISILGYQLTGAQLFIKNLFNPNTLHKQLLINWQTGVGKSIAAIAIGNEFIKFFQEQYVIKRKAQMVCILGFNTIETIKADMLKYPELGYVTEYEVKELNRMLLEDDTKLTQFSASLQRRISDRVSGGYYKFFGYREFVNSLFIVTDKGIINKISLQDVLIPNDDKSILEEYVNDGLLRINTELINSLKNGLIICDEIHNVYNSLESNNYGLAIQYVLNSLQDEAPRIIFMSATPITGNASEVIDLLNLLNPNTNLKRSDYFYRDSDGIYQLKSNTLDEITRLTTNKVSFLLDSDVDLYPTRIFDGESNDIPYLKFINCIPSDFHNNTINQETTLTYSQTIRSIYDIAFPNPESETIGLYNSSEIFNIYQKANLEWKNKIGIDTYSESGVNVITGNFLKLDNIKKYSTKYYNVISDLLNNIKNKQGGKIMIFHYNVQVSGVVLIQELLKMNGFIDEISEPNNSTLCVICGTELGEHKEGHKEDHNFKPCRFIIAHSNITKIVMKRNIAKFNDISNLHGTEIKVIIGSRIIQEGLNFKAIRYQYILSLPINFPILIQVLGRVVRKNSHIDLPVDDRNVHIRIYAYNIEIPRYKYKSKEYLVIQEVEKAIRINAVDNFINYKKLSLNNNTLESLQLVPTNTEKPKIDSKYYDAYGYNNEEINVIIRILTLLFNVRPVWTLDDIINSIKDININFNTDLIDNDNVELAIQKMNVHHIGKYYIKSKVLDIECYIRNPINISMKSINISQFYSKTSFNKLFTTIMSKYEETYIKQHIEISLITLPDIFHIELLKQIILGKVNNPKIIDLYKRFKILIFQNDKPIGYLDNTSVNIYNVEQNVWENKPHIDYNIGKRYDENKYIIGYVVNENNETKLKLREPISTNKYSDLRSVRKGMVCENNIREDLINTVTQLRKINEFTSYASKYDSSITKGSNDNLCKIIKLYLLSFEEKSRNLSNGMKNSSRWIYLFHDTLPNIMLK